MKFWTYKTLLCCWFCIFSTMLFAQQVNRKQQQNRLQQLRSKIENYRLQVKREEQKELKILDALAQLEREIDMTHQLLSELQKEERKKSRQISRISRELESTGQELQRLQDIYARRIVSFYKYGRIKDLELLLLTKSFNQALTWFRFQKLIAQNDRRNYLNILKKKQKIEKQRNKLKQEIIEQRKIIKEKKDEEAKLRAASKERNRLLAQVQHNKETFLRKLKENEASAREIQRLINIEVDRQASLEKDGFFQSTDFPSLKGRMIWPTNGVVVTHFGPYRHPRWKTVTQNLGIDIKADFGQDVRATSKGIVTAITWYRGRGNIVIISHLGGYFTVYTHLSQIFVQVDDTVEEGQVIGSVGDSGSLQGPILHFEIWKNNQVLNPEDWLS